MQPKVSVSFLALNFKDLDDFVEHIKANLPSFDILKINVVAYESLEETEFSKRGYPGDIVEEEFEI